MCVDFSWRPPTRIYPTRDGNSAAFCLRKRWMRVIAGRFPRGIDVISVQRLLYAGHGSELRGEDMRSSKTTFGAVLPAR
jgi:hypothetical protein